MCLLFNEKIEVVIIIVAFAASTFDQSGNRNMEGLKNKYGEESREDKKNRHRKLFFPSVVSFSVCIAMVIVGKAILLKF